MSQTETHFYHRGFRSAFDRGCLSLWFNFRRNVSALEAVVQFTLTIVLCSSTGSNPVRYLHRRRGTKCSLLVKGQYIAPLPHMEGTSPNIVVIH